MSVISGTAYWASLQSPNTKFEPSWQIEVCNLDAENKAIAEKDNLTIKYDDVKGDYVSIKRKVKRKDGNNNQPPIVVDAQKRPMLDLIANGSKVNVLYSTFEWKYAGKQGVSADLKKVQVVELIPYEEKEDFDEIPDGYTSADEAGAEKIPFAS
tara:strand:+ start:3387 stop:3848 length:462 start_codon:yes stop_codon:yes gene_type:complete